MRCNAIREYRKCVGKIKSGKQDCDGISINALHTSRLDKAVEVETIRGISAG